MDNNNNNDFFEAFKSFKPDKNNNNNNEDVNINDNDEEKIEDISSCKSIKRISQILTYYISWIKQIESSLLDNNIDINNNNNNNNLSFNPPSIGMFDIINSGKYLGNYNNTMILNDFHYIINKYNYHLIYDIFNKNDNENCIYNNNNLCKLLCRNHRNKNKNYLNNILRKQLYYGYNQSTEITTQQILDYIHCFIYHSYEINMIFTPKQQNELLKNEKQYENIDDDDDDEYINELSKSINNKNNNINNKQNNNFIQIPKKPKLPKRGSMIYNEKIEHKDDASSTEHSIVSDASTNPDESFSFTPQPNENDNDEKTNGNSSSSSSSISSNSPFRIKKRKNNNGNIITSATSKNIKEKLLNVDSNLDKKIKISNSKIVLIKQILNKNNNNNNNGNILNKIKIYNNNENICKYINILTSYNHLLAKTPSIKPLINTKYALTPPITPITPDDNDINENNKITLNINHDDKFDTININGKHQYSVSVQTPSASKPIFYLIFILIIFVFIIIKFYLFFVNIIILKKKEKYNKKTFVFIKFGTPQIQI